MTTATLKAPIRRGLGYWAASYAAMLRWVLTQQRTFFVAIIFSQTVLGIGAAIMYKFYLGALDPVSALYLVSGIPALSLIPVGFLLVPILVSQERTRGTQEFTWSLPVPRLVPVLAAFTVFTAIGLPVATLSTWLSAVQFDVTLTVTWTVLPFALLVSLMATSVGYGMAMAVPDPRMSVMITNIVIFVVLLFSPIVIPIERFPDWAEAVHFVLPFYHMANLLRSSLTEGLATNVGLSLAILIAWTVVSWAVLARIVVKRG